MLHRDHELPALFTISVSIVLVSVLFLNYLSDSLSAGEELYQIKKQRCIDAGGIPVEVLERKGTVDLGQKCLNPAVFIEKYIGE